MLRKKFRETVRRYGMDQIMQRSGAVIAAFSGGADSTALVILLSEYAKEHGLKLILAHVNHMIRGEEADADEGFVRETAEKMGALLYVKRADVPALAKEWGKGIEEAARDIRYAFFRELSEEYGGAPIATAHNSSDNLETVLFHMMRGSGLTGLCGIAPVRDGMVLRPLITCSSAEIRTFCEREGISFRIDSTNADTDYARNFIRHRIIPQMAAFSASPEDAASRMTELLRWDSDYLEAEAERLCPAGTCSYDRDGLRELSPALSSRILRKMASETTGERGNGPEYGHVKAMLDLVGSEKSEGSLSLPNGTVFYVSRRTVFFAPKELEEKADEGENFRFFIPEEGAVFENERYKIAVSPDEHTVCTEEYENIYKLSIHKILCSDKIIGTLYIKYRNQGDTYRYGGMTRKIKKLMIDRKLTADEKRLLPLLCDESGVLWMPGFPLRDGTDGEHGAGKKVHLYFFEKY